MTGRERLLAVLNGQMPDRVPVTLFLADQGHFITQIHPDLDPWDHEACQLKIVAFLREMGCDVLLRCLYGINDPLNIHTGGLFVHQQTADWEVHTEDVRDGQTLIKRSTIRTPGGTLTQDYSIFELRPGTFMYACTRKPIQTEHDLDIAIQYEPRMPADWPARTRAKLARLKAAVGDDGIVATWTPHGPFNNASLLIDLDRLYSLYLEDYPFYVKLMTFAMERILDYARGMDDAGTDLHCVGGNVPGGFLGKKNYDTYVLPFERKYIEFVQAQGTPAMYHNCGQVMGLVDSYKALGVRVVEPFSPVPLGDVTDLAAVKRTVNGAYVMLSGVDQVNILQQGTVDDVERATERAILSGKPGGGFILQSIDFLEYGTPLENLEAFVKTALKHAAY